MKKFSIILLFIFTLSIFSFVDFSHNNHTNPPALADSGFDSDYGDYDDGYYWDDDYSDSSWDDDYDNDYWDNDYDNDRGNSNHSGTTLPTYLIVLIVLIPICFYVVIVYLAVAKKYGIRITKSRKHIINAKSILASNFGLKTGDGADVELIQLAYKNYVEIQKSWMERDISPVRNLLTDEIYNMYQMQVKTLIADNQINVMSNFQFVCGKINSIVNINNVETIRILLCVKCKDYIKTAHKNKVISGSKRDTLTYIYELTFVRDVNREKTTNCPACGALIKKQMSATCPYCNSSLLLTSPNLTMSDKKMLYQFRKK